MGHTAKPTRQNRTITVDFQDEATYFQLLHKTSCSEGGSLTRHSHSARVRLGGLTIWRMPCTRGKAVFTVLPHVVLRYRTMKPDVARHAL